MLVRCVNGVRALFVCLLVFILFYTSLVFWSLGSLSKMASYLHSNLREEGKQEKVRRESDGGSFFNSRCTSQKLHKSLLFISPGQNLVMLSSCKGDWKYVQPKLLLL